MFRPFQCGTTSKCVHLRPWLNVSKIEETQQCAAPCKHVVCLSVASVCVCATLWKRKMYGFVFCFFLFFSPIVDAQKVFASDISLGSQQCKQDLITVSPNRVARRGHSRFNENLLPFTERLQHVHSVTSLFFPAASRLSPPRWNFVQQQSETGALADVRVRASLNHVLVRRLNASVESVNSTTSAKAEVELMSCVGWK